MKKLRPPDCLYQKPQKYNDPNFHNVHKIRIVTRGSMLSSLALMHACVCVCVGYCLNWIWNKWARNASNNESGLLKWNARQQIILYFYLFCLASRHCQPHLIHTYQYVKYTHEWCSFAKRKKKRGKKTKHNHVLMLIWTHQPLKPTTSKSRNWITHCARTNKDVKSHTDKHVCWHVDIVTISFFIFRCLAAARCFFFTCQQLMV